MDRSDNLIGSISISNELLRTYFFYVSILVIKILFMAFLTAQQRFKHKAFTNPEDVRSSKLKIRTDDNVERVRRAHLNDLENIIPFIIASTIFITTSPALALATLLFRIVTITRILHTFVYAVYVVPQPARVLCCLPGYFVTFYMAAHSILYYM